MHKLLENKKIVFLDGDGTIWYPEKTKREIKPHWIYKDEEIGENFLQHLVLIPSVVETLEKLKEKGIILILLSTHPHPQEEADILLKNKVQYFKLENLFDEFYTARDYPDGKGEIIDIVLKARSISPSQAILIGDSYIYDYLSAKKVGADAILMDSDYLDTEGTEVERIIRFNDLLK
jgi:HAD superfamily phosphatase (TIGR01681 family)